MKLYIKNMYCRKDIEVVVTILETLNIPYDAPMQCGVINIFPENFVGVLAELRGKLLENHFHIIFDRKTILTEQVKQLLLDMFENDKLPIENYSVFISRHLNLNYNYIATVFSEIEGVSIEHFIIRQKIKKAKQMLVEGTVGVGEIALKLHYSSIGHFSNQFKKITGDSPSGYRKQIHTALTDA